MGTVHVHVLVAHIHVTVITRTMHAYDTLRRAKRQFLYAWVRRSFSPKKSTKQRCEEYVLSTFELLFFVALLASTVD